MKKDFNESVNEFINWFVRNNAEEPISEEDFNVRLEKRKEEMVDNMEYFMDKFKNAQGFLERAENSTINPFHLLFLLMLFPKFGDDQKLFEGLIGRKASKEEIEEYVKLITNKSNINDIVTFLESTELKGDLAISPVAIKLFDLKDIVLPYFQELNSEAQKKVEEFYKNNNAYGNIKSM